MINKLLWFSFGFSVAFGIMAIVLVTILSNTNSFYIPKKIEKLLKICTLIFIILGLLVSISWCFCDYWKFG